MKRNLLTILMGFIGGFVAFIMLNYIDFQSQEKIISSSQKTLRVSNKKKYHAHQANFVNNNLPNAVKKAQNSVVHIYTKGKSIQKNYSDLDWFFGSPFEQQREGSGSGVIYRANGYIVTNNHVIEHAEEIEVTLYNNKKYIAKVVGTYPQADIAVLKIESSENLPILELANASESKVGQWVMAIGHPLELKLTVTAGIISAKNRDIGILDNRGNIINQGTDKLESFIQTDAAVNPGNSGGALIDSEGNLLGINTAIATQSGYYQGYSFAIPINIVDRIVSDIIKYGKYKRPYIGISASTLDFEYLSEHSIDKINFGVIIDAVTENSPADISGLQKDDIIVAVNNIEIKNVPELNGKINDFFVGQEITLSILRNGKFSKKELKLAEK